MLELNPASWQALSPHLDRVLAIDPSERADFLASLRAENPSLAAGLELLLEEHRALEAEHFLEQPPADLPRRTVIAGEIIGAYRLREPIGKGGMGDVWLAERNDGRFERQAAVKFLNIAFGRGGEERFHREGTILGRLAHPHIAQLMDAGVSSSGQPYLVLEYVSGQPLDEYCDARTLDIEARVRLFLDVLDAVAHAHANLIVHRDLKPSNVLVSAEGQVKLLDFGIAKLVDDDMQTGSATALTREAGGAMTLLYAAPEQVTGGNVTTATDVYALGVLLCVLLAGRHPAGPGPYSPAELIKSITEIEALRLSDLPLPDDAAATRATTSEKLRRQLRGDLDTIGARALKKNPEERYLGVGALAADLRRYLSHQPIEARPDTLSYRAIKFIRRNRMPVALAALAVTGSLAGVLGTIHQARSADRERAIAERRFNQVRQLSNKVLSLNSEIMRLPGSAKARHEIVAMSKEYLEALGTEADKDPKLALEIGVAFGLLARAQGVPGAPGLGDYAQAEESLRKGEALLDTVLQGAPQNRKALLISAQIAGDRMSIADSEHRREDTLTHAHKGAERLDTLLGLGKEKLTQSEISSVSIAFNNLALASKNNHAYADAIRYARRSLEILRLVPFEPARFAIAWSLLADSMRLSGDLEGALEGIREARRSLEGAQISSELRRRTVWFSVLWREGAILGEDGSISLDRPAEAIPVLQRAFDLIEEWAGKDPDDASSRMLFVNGGGALGNLLRDRDPKRALAVYDLSLRRLGEIKSNIKARRGEAEILAHSSYALRRLNRPREAQDRIDRALKLLRETKDYPDSRVNLGNEADIALRALADHQVGVGQPGKAAGIYQELLDKIRASKPDPEHDLRQAILLSRLYENLGAAHRRSGQPGQAEAMSVLRLELWRHWQTRLPQNSFVTRQHTAAARP